MSSYGQTLLDEMLRQVQLGLLLRKLRALLAASGTDSSNDGLVDGLDAVYERLINKSLCLHVASVVEANADVWPPARAAGFDELFGFRERLASAFSRYANERQKSSGQDVSLDDLASQVLKKAVDFAAQDKPKELAAGGKRPPLNFGLTPRREGLVEHWINAGAALDTWMAFKKTYEAAPQVNEWQRKFAQQADELQERARQLQSSAQAYRNSTKADFSRLFVGRHDRYVSKVLDWNASAFETCARLLRDAQGPCAAVMDRLSQGGARLLIKVVLQCLSDDATWPPLLLLRLPKELRFVNSRTGSFWKALLETGDSAALEGEAISMLTRLRVDQSHDSVERLILFLRVLGYIDQHLRQSGTSVSETKVNEGLRDFGQALFDRFDWDVVAIRGGPAPAEYFHTIVDEQRHTRVVEQSGVLLQVRDDKELMRQAVIRQPPQTPPLDLAFTKLRRSVETLEKADEDLVELCDQASGLLGGHESLHDWWQAARQEPDQNRLSLVSHFMERISVIALSDPGGPAARVLGELERLGLRLAPLAASNASATGGVPLWCVAPLQPWTTVRGPVALTGPDGEQFAAMNWLMAPAQWLETRPLARCLAACEAQRRRLARAVPDVGLWQDWSNLLVDLCSAEIEQRSDLVCAAVDLFTGLYQQSLLRGRYAAEFLDLARRLRACLVDELGTELSPALDDKSLQPRRLTEKLATAGKLDWTWACSDKPVGEVLGVERFHCAGRRGSVVLSCGNVWPSQWLPCLTIHRIPPDADEGLVPDVLREFSNALTAIPWSGAAAIPELKRHVTAVVAWIAGGEGEKWLNGLLQVRVARARPDPAQRWLLELLIGLESGGSLQVYPTMEHRDAAVRWPLEKTDAGQKIQWTADDSSPTGQLVGTKVWFSTDPERARGTFSLGRDDGQASAVLADEILRLAQAGELTELAQAATALRHWSLVQARVSASGGTEVDLAPAALFACLDALGELDRVRPASSGDLESMVSAMRKWCGVFGWVMTPVAWASGRPLTKLDLALDQRTDVPAEFSETVPRGELLVKQLGLKTKLGRELRPSQFGESAGPPPHEYGELLARLESIQDSRCDALAEAMRGWPARCLKSPDVLRYAIQEEFLDKFWDLLGGDFRQKFGDGFAMLEKTLAALLERQFGCVMFFPVRLSDWREGWIKFVNSGSQEGGRIRRVLRPGLRTRTNDLISKAKVEVE